MTKSFTKAQRLRAIEDLLGDATLTTSDVLEALGLDPSQRRTLQRDLEELALHDRIESQGPRWRAVRRAGALNEVQALAVYSAARMLFHHAYEYNEHYRSALGHLANSLPAPVRDLVLEANAQYTGKDSGEASRSLEQAALAWIRGEVLRFEYHRPGKSVLTVELETHLIEVSVQNRAAYVIGRNRLFEPEKVRIYKVTRMKHASRLTNSTYDRPAPRDALKYLSNAWGIMTGPPTRVTLHFRPEVAERLAEEPLHCCPTGPTRLPSGWTQVVLEVGGTLELEPWIKSWGAMVVVLEPASLRDKIARDLSEAARQYTELSR